MTFRLNMSYRIKKRVQSELPLQRSIWEFLMFNGVWCYINYQPPGKQRIWQHQSSVGASDIQGIFRGKPLYIEVKHKAGRKGPTKAQLRFLENVKANGGIGFVAWSVDEVAKHLGLRI